MKKSTKVLLGVATIWPVLYICVFTLRSSRWSFLGPYVVDRPDRDQYWLPLVSWA